MLRILALLLLLAACQTRHEIPVADLQVVQLTADTWRAKGLPEPEDCVEDVGIHVLHEGNFMKYCGIPAAFSYGCVVNRGIGSFGHDKVIFLSPAVRPADRDKALASLTLHALAECTSTWDTDKFDTANRRRGVWIESSGDASVEAAVYSILDSRAK